MTVAFGIIVFLGSAIAVILLAIRLDRYENELERRFHLREQGAKGGEAESRSASIPDSSRANGGWPYSHNQLTR